MFGFIEDLFGGGGADTSAIDKTAAGSLKLSQDQFDWFKQYVEDTQDDRDATQARANAVSDAQVEAMGFSTQEARRLSERNQSVFEPLQDSIVTDAQNFDTASRRKGASDAAIADVETQFGNQQAATTRAIGRTGGTLGGRAAALLSDNQIAKAKASAGASTQAVNNVEAQGYARRMDAAGLGSGIVGNQATMQNIAAQAGSGAVASSGSGLTAQQSAAPIMSTGFSGATSANQIAGNLYGQSAQIQNNNNSSAATMQGIGGIMQGVGAMYGSGMFGSSDEKKKTNIKDVPDEKALQEVTGLDSKAWRYKKGQGDEGEHIGPMAGQVRRIMGDKIAPGGEMIDLTAMGKKNEAAIRALTAQLDGVLAEIAELEAA